MTKVLCAKIKIIMERKEWKLGPDDAQRRLDRLLRKLLAQNSQGQILSALRKGLVKVNGKKAQASYVTQEGDLLSAASFLLEEESPDPSALQRPIPYKIVFENDSLLFIDKPAGLPVHGPGSIAEYFAGVKNSSISFVSAPLHRLDKGTSGLLAVSKSLEGARWFSQNLRERKIQKYYWGIAVGRLEKEELWEDELLIQEDSEKKGFYTPQALAADCEEKGLKGAKAKTLASPLKKGFYNGKEITLVQYQIFTGRKRQIRAQSAFHGFPLLGDKNYGEQGPRFYLKSMKMAFPPNDLGLPPFIQAEEPQDFLDFFKEPR